jgi:hypothetical protein
MSFSALRHTEHNSPTKMLAELNATRPVQTGQQTPEATPVSEEVANDLGNVAVPHAVELPTPVESPTEVK